MNKSEHTGSLLTGTHSLHTWTHTYTHTRTHIHIHTWTLSPSFLHTLSCTHIIPLIVSCITTIIKTMLLCLFGPGLLDKILKHLWTWGQFHKRQTPAFKMPNSGIYMHISKYQFLETLLAFKTPKSSILINNIAKKQGV